MDQWMGIDRLDSVVLRMYKALDAHPNEEQKEFLWYVLN